jgi:hypothetical protein
LDGFWIETNTDNPIFTLEDNAKFTEEGYVYVEYKIAGDPKSKTTKIFVERNSSTFTLSLGFEAMNSLPARVFDIDSTSDKRSVTLSWARPDVKPELILGYDIYRDGKLIKSKYKKTKYKDNKLAAGQVFTYKITIAYTDGTVTSPADADEITTQTLS